MLCANIFILYCDNLRFFFSYERLFWDSTKYNEFTFSYALPHMFITRVDVCTRCTYHTVLTKGLRNRCESFFIDRVKRIFVASKVLYNSLLVKNKFRVHVEPRANLRLSEMLLGKFRVAATEARSFMRAYL